MTNKNKGPTKKKPTRSRLTDRQEEFIYRVVKGSTQADAYRHAYSTKNMADKTIIEKASKLMAQDNIRARYDELKGKITQRLEEDCIVTVEEVVRELKKVAFADIKDFLEYKTDLSVVAYEDGEPVTDYRTVVQLKESEMVDGTMIGEVSISRDGTLKFKLHDKMVALEKIGKHLGMFTDKVEHSGKIEMPTIILTK
jgi:phage terminase small subunit